MCLVTSPDRPYGPSNSRKRNFSQTTKRRLSCRHEQQSRTVPACTEHNRLGTLPGIYWDQGRPARLGRLPETFRWLCAGEPDTCVSSRFWLLFATLVLILAAAASAHSQAENKVVATVNGRRITENEVDLLVMAQTLPLEQKLFAIRKAALENLITVTVLENEAQKRGLSVPEMRKQLAMGEVLVTPQQVEEAYAANAAFFGNMSPDEAKERLRLDLENQQRMENYRRGLARLKQTATISLHFESEQAVVRDESVAPSIGPDDAPITIVEFADFECLYCRTAQNTIKQLLQAYEKQIKLVFKHLPLEFHQHAFPAAQAAFCAGQQGLFWQYHDALFATETFGAESFNKIAGDLGLKLPQFNRCWISNSSRNAVWLNMREASRLGINSTPTFVINGELISGALTFKEFKAIIDRKLSSASNSRDRQP